MPLTKNEISSMIMSAFPDATLELNDTAGDSNHYSAKIESKVFKGKSKVEQHKLVYKALEGVEKSAYNLAKGFETRYNKNTTSPVGEKYFLDDFNNGLTRTLFPPGDQFIKLVFQNMNGKRITDKVQKRIGELINSLSLQNHGQ